MSSRSSSLVLDVDTSIADLKIAEVQRRTIEVANVQVATINRASELSLLALQATGYAVDATFRVQTIAIRTAINTYIQTRAALAASNPLLGVGTAITGGVMLYLLYQQLQAIETGRSETSAQMSASFSIVRQAGGVYL
jgi:hypothetical protein